MQWWLISLFSAIQLVEGLRWVLARPWLPAAIRQLRQSLEAFITAENDDGRQAAILRLAGFILAASLLVLLILALAAAWVMASLAVWSANAAEETSYWVGQTLFALLWLWFCRPAFGRLKSAYAAGSTGSPYSLSQKWLHWMVLDSRWIRKLLFDIERAVFLRNRKAGHRVELPPERQLP
jgi:hypothetical protein